jgi:hypothetical protein
LYNPPAVAFATAGDVKDEVLLGVLPPAFDSWPARFLSQDNIKAKGAKRNKNRDVRAPHPCALIYERHPYPLRSANPDALTMDRVLSESLLTIEHCEDLTRCVEPGRVTGGKHAKICAQAT